MGEQRTPKNSVTEPVIDSVSELNESRSLIINFWCMPSSNRARRRDRARSTAHAGTTSPQVAIAAAKAYKGNRCAVPIQDVQSAIVWAATGGGGGSRKAPSPVGAYPPAWLVLKSRPNISAVICIMIAGLDESDLGAWITESYSSGAPASPCPMPTLLEHDHSGQPDFSRVAMHVPRWRNQMAACAPAQCILRVQPFRSRAARGTREASAIMLRGSSTCSTDAVNEREQQVTGTDDAAGSAETKGHCIHHACKSSDASVQTVGADIQAGEQTPKISCAPSSLKHLCLTQHEMAEHSYPSCDRPLPPGFRRATEPSIAREKQPDGVLALDCEMCETCDGLELTRISVVDQSLKCVYDSLVLPYNPIIDYKTQFSGITAEMMADVTTRLEDVQEWLLHNLIHPDTILVGHSLEHDLKCLKIMHRWVIDTSILYPVVSKTYLAGFSRRYKGRRRLKAKLSVLAKEYLGAAIQTGLSGHDSSIDAATCMQLVHRWLHFGGARTVDEVSRFNRPSSPENPTSLNADGEEQTISDVLSRKGVTICAIDKPNLLVECFPGELCSIHPAENDSHAAELCISCLKQLSSSTNNGSEIDFVWCHLHALKDVKAKCCTSDVLHETLLSTDQQLRNIIQAVPKDALIVCLSGESTRTLEVGRHGYAFLGVKSA